ncbi:hypothetical protein GOV03_01840 [Candidatus Woesearchaeota archaeon]|nr:hypothetical protein [Candidatus Woesearchaeota archaeon]
MPNPQFIEETPVTLVDVQEALQEIEERDKELNYRSNKTKEFLGLFTHVSKEKKEELYKKLTDLKLIRLKEAHIIKIIDFLPLTLEELKVILQAYPVSMPKKDMESIVATVKEVAE